VEDFPFNNNSNGALITPTALAISPKSVTRQIGQTQQFVATATFSEGSTADVTTLAQWSSSNGGLVTVNASTGLATALLPGQVTITAQASGFSDTATMTVPRLMARVSVDSAGVQGDGHSLQSNISADSLSADGRFVAFESEATNLVTGDSNAVTDVFVHDRQTGATNRISVSSAGVQGDGSSFKPKISDDGRFVSFNSNASNLVAGDSNGVSDSFVHDRQTGTTTRVSVDSAAAQGNSSSFEASISGDGRFVAFQSQASNLVTGDSNASDDVFVHDRQTGATTRVSVGPGAVQANAGSAAPSISADGRIVAFHSNASNLVAVDTNAFQDVFVHDRQTGSTSLVSLDTSDVQGNSSSIRASISADGRFIAFESSAENLVPGDSNGFRDVFVTTR